MVDAYPITNCLQKFNVLFKSVCNVEGIVISYTDIDTFVIWYICKSAVFVGHTICVKDTIVGKPPNIFVL